MANPDGFPNPLFLSGLDPLAVRAAQESAIDPSEWVSVTEADDGVAEVECEPEAFVQHQPRPLLQPGHGKL